MAAYRVDQDGPAHFYSYTGTTSRRVARKDNFLIPFLIANGADLLTKNENGQVPQEMVGGINLSCLGPVESFMKVVRKYFE
jgi:hypothetical protein